MVLQTFLPRTSPTLFLTSVSQATSLLVSHGLGGVSAPEGSLLHLLVLGGEGGAWLCYRDLVVLAWSQLPLSSTQHVPCRTPAVSLVICPLIPFEGDEY